VATELQAFERQGRGGQKAKPAKAKATKAKAKK
jgi:hypothetical protein